jgi:hypothetical protein
MKQLSDGLGSLLVCGIWAAIFYYTGVFGFIGTHYDQIILTGRIAVVALGPFTFIAMFLLVDGKPSSIALKVLAPLLGIGWIAMTAAERADLIPIRFLSFFAQVSVYMLIWVPLVGWVSSYASTSWPIIGYLGGVCLILVLMGLARDKQIPPQSLLVVNTIRGLLLPVGFGLTLVCWMQAIFNLFDQDVKSIGLTENHIGYLSEQAKAWIDFSPPSSLALMLSLMFITLLVPKLKAVTRVNKAKKAFHAVAAVVACVSSFTFFAQAPFKYQDHQETKRVKAEREKNADRNDLRLVAVQSVQRSLQEMTPEDRDRCRERFKEMFSEINELVPYREHGRLIEAMAQHTLEVAPDSADISSTLFTLEKKAGFDPTAPGSDAIIRKPGDPNSRPDDELLAGVGAIFGDLLGAASPEMKGMAGKFIDSLIDKEADFFFDTHIRPILKTHLDDILPITSMFSTALIANRFRGEASTENVRGDLAVEKDEVRKEVKKEEERVAEENRIREASAPHEIRARP